MEIVRIENVSRSYNGQYAVTAVDRLSLSVERGEFVCLAGPSGSGKTTVLNLIGGLDRPTSGVISVEGNDIVRLSGNALSRLRLYKIGFVFQELNLIPVLSAWENVEFSLLLQKVPADERRRRVQDILEELGLSALAHRRPSAMSGGQQQRVAIGRAVVAHPLLILADEPTANLDSHTAQNLIDLMHRLNRTRNITFIIATHDEQVMQQAHRVVHLRDGRIVSDTGQRSGAG